ncbi:hypothetical protein F9L07_28205 [Pimelobacter simplex]|uniref:Uncharacterized protein n=1 Tax=Nocardioides simplex TaxID=2045 RepID=A0A7J5DQJ4_NOCSI|nr:hypothetical protein [Pimelobacter simplex]KAB2806921.1 hypothetical protein F9L07_28205 [Pimelobacter simplex]
MKMHIKRNETDEDKDGIFYKGKTKAIHTHEAEGYEPFFHTFHTRIVSVKVTPSTRGNRCVHAVKPPSTGLCLWMTTVRRRHHCLA